MSETVALQSTSDAALAAASLTRDNQYSKAMDALAERFLKMDSQRRGAFLDGMSMATLAIHRAAGNLEAGGAVNSARAFHHLAASIDGLGIELKGIRRKKPGREH